MLFTLSDIRNRLDMSFEHLGNPEIMFSKFSNLENPTGESIYWISPKLKDKELAINDLPSSVVVVIPNGLDLNKLDLDEKLYLVVEEPKLLFTKILIEFFTTKKSHSIHPSATIHDQAKLAENVHIGPNVYIGKSIIGENTVVDGNCFIYDNVIIGRDCHIQPNTTIGAAGFGYVKDHSNKPIRVPHFGGVIIGNNVDIGASTCIDRGTLGNTIIQDNAKIDNLVHVAHNVNVGQGSYVIANSMLGGSTVIGENVWIAPSASLINKISIAKNSVIGMSAVVTKDVIEEGTYAGFPARPLDQFISIQKKLKEL